jgi:Zn-dependent protease
MIDRSRLTRAKMALAVLMGPAGNFLFAGLGIVLVSLCMHQDLLGLNRIDWIRSDAWRVIEWPLWYSVALGFLNLLPIPPLDGGHVVACFLPLRAQRIWYALAPLGLILLIGGMLYMGGVFASWGYPGPPPGSNPFYLVDTMVKRWVHSMMPFWDSVL